MSNTDRTISSNNELDSAIESMAKMIDSMVEQFIDHPGFMWTASGFEGLHADWPAYPVGHGWRTALASLSDFPADTKFFPIDNIDQCTLFVVDEIPKTNKYGKDHYHIALWNEDIVELAQLHLINDALVQDKSLEFAFLDFPDGYISLSPAGEHAVLVYELAFDIHPDIMSRVEDFLLNNRYDTALREANILLETRMRQAIGSKKHTQLLVEECFGTHGKLFPAKLPNSTRLEIRAVFRRLFKYIRNEFAHNFKSIDLVTTTRLLRRCSRLLVLLESLKKNSTTANSQSKS